MWARIIELLALDQELQINLLRAETFHNIRGMALWLNNNRPLVPAQHRLDSHSEWNCKAGKV